MSDVNRIWVCGPPIMSQTFEEAFDSEEFKDNKFEKGQFEIL